MKVESKKTVKLEAGVDYYSDFCDTFGLEDPNFGIRIVKEKLRGLIEGGYIENFDDIALYNLFASSGLLFRNSKYGIIFDELPKLNRSRELIDELRNWANSLDKDLPTLHPFQKPEEEIDEKILDATVEEIQDLASETTSPFEKDPKQTLEKKIDRILETALKIDTYVDDPEKMKFFENYELKKFWKIAFEENDAEKIVKHLKSKQDTENEFTKSLNKKFFSEYYGSLQIKNEIPSNYSFRYAPSLMQLYVAHKIKTEPYFCNFSGTGAGKTLSAILASRIIDSKMTLVICPNSIVEQWKNSIIEVFPDSIVKTKKDAFNVKRDEKKHQYLILNWDSLQHKHLVNELLKIEKQKIDLIVLDEIHFVKVRGSNVSARRENLQKFMNGIREDNPKSKVLGMSATPVVNSLSEGKSLLDLVKGWEDMGLKVNATIPNAVALHEKLSNISIREMPKYAVFVNEHKIPIYSEWPEGKSSSQLIANPLEAEQILTDIRIPKIIELIEGPTVIYTEYVGSTFDKRSERIIEKLTKAIQDSGYTVAHYTGEDKSGFDLFTNRKRDVLIASRPIGVGVDDLQHVCNRLIINTLPWTHAGYEQLLGRFIRRGQTKNVDVYILLVNLGGWLYDQQHKWSRILVKKTLAECAVDGMIPKKNLVSPEQATKAAVEWLQRLEEGKESCVPIRRLTGRLSPIEVKKRVRKYGNDLTELNMRINSQKSQTTNIKMRENNGEMWEEYHRRLDDTRKEWRLDPLDEIIKKIKTLPPGTPIGDFGCGRAKIADEYGNRVHSFDHVAIDSRVKSCDISMVPLKDGDLGISVFCLSLMGKNWPDYIREASRCLSKNGTLLVVETTQSLSEHRLKNLRNVIEENGFVFNKEGCYNEYKFTFIEARKI